MFGENHLNFEITILFKKYSFTWLSKVKQGTTIEF